MAQDSKGLLVVIAAPSGGGKTTIANELLSRFSNAKRLITCTTRPARNTEIPNQDYVFLSNAQFDEQIKANMFAEWATVHGNRYGTSKRSIEESLSKGEILLMTIDIQGAKSIKAQYPKSLSIFMMPPDFDILETRLRKRGTETDADIRTRLETARREIVQAKDLDFQVLNDRLDRAALEIESIIRKRLGA
jgi:guanylate kinase